MFFKPISWGIDLGYEHFKEENDYLKIKPEIGLSFGQNKEYIYTMLSSNIYYKANEQLASIGTNIGFVTNRFKNFKIGLNYSYDKYNKNFENKQFEGFITYKLNRNASLNLRYLNDNLYEKQDILKVGVSYYF